MRAALITSRRSRIAAGAFALRPADLVVRPWADPIASLTQKQRSAGQLLSRACWGSAEHWGPAERGAPRAAAIGGGRASSASAVRPRKRQRRPRWKAGPASVERRIG